MSEVSFLSNCLRLIELKLNIGSSRHWTIEEYKTIQKLIFEASGINLSIETLERLYGKLKIHKNYKPQVATKTALAIFLGYSDWEDFKSQNPLNPREPLQAFELIPDENKSEENAVIVNRAGIKKRKFGKPTRSLIIFFVLICLVGIAIVFARRKPNTVSKLNFKAENAIGRAPHTVKFTFDLSDQEGDNFSIIIPYLHVTVKLQKEQKSAFVPVLVQGWYRAYLMSDNNTMGETFFFIKTEGWRVTITNMDKYNQNTVYRTPLPLASVAAEGRLYTSSSFLPDSIQKKRGYYFLTYYNVRNFNVNGDNVTFETRFRNKAQEENSLCNDMIFNLVGLKGMFKIHFVTAGCTGFIDMAFGEKLINGGTQSLTPFGTNMQPWKKALLEVINKTVNVYLDGRLIYKTKYSRSVGTIVGIELTSRSSGETDYVKLYNEKKQLVYEDDFGGKVSD
jgi:hypothetical protein